MNLNRTVFIVDDNDTSMALAEEALGQHYRIMTVPSAKKMFSLLEWIIPDLILLDIEMPEMDGFEALEKLSSIAEYENIVVIFLTDQADPDSEARGLELGAADFITKPFTKHVLLRRIQMRLDINSLVIERTNHLLRLKNGVVSVLAEIVESRDKTTGGHIERTTAYIKVLMEEMMAHGIYADEMRSWDFQTTISSARLHDIGKIAIPDSILNKPGPLSPEEFEVIKTHAKEGENIISRIVDLSGEVDFLYSAKMFAGYHHERWDGEGYPHGLKGEGIPLQGRIMAIVDVYDALVSDRPYKKAFTQERAERIIMEGSGREFDPTIMEAFLRVKKHFKEIKIVLMDSQMLL